MKTLSRITRYSLTPTRPNYPQSDPELRQERLVRRVQDRDLEAFNQLVLLHQDSVFRQALWILNDAAAAEDASQEAFLLAYRKIQSFHGGSFRAWLLKITTNCCLDLIRFSKRRPCQPFGAILKAGEGEENELGWLNDPADPPEKVIERNETGEAIRRAVQKLAPEFRLPVILIDLQELDYVEASAILQIPLGTLKSRLARARLKLRDDFLHRMEPFARTENHSVSGQVIYHI